MKSETLSNFVQGTIALLLGVFSFIGGIATGMAHCYWLAAGSITFGLFFYFDKEYGTESVIAFFTRKIRK